MYPIAYFLVPLIWAACCATAEFALNKVGFSSTEVQTIVPSGEPSGPDNEGGTLIKYGEALQQLLDQKVQNKAQLQTEIDIKRAAGWSSADLRLLTARQRMFEREIQVYQAELASFSPSLTRLSSSYGWISAHRNY